MHLLGCRRPLKATVASTCGERSPVMLSTGGRRERAEPSMGFPLDATSLDRARSVRCGQGQVGSLVL